MLVSGGTLEKNNSSASRPPADAPIPTMGNSGRAFGGFGALFLREVEAALVEVTLFGGRDIFGTFRFFICLDLVSFFLAGMVIPSIRRFVE